jgi:hypothetical protein
MNRLGQRPPAFRPEDVLQRVAKRTNKGRCTVGKEAAFSLTER